jgi:hypothetical protein
MPTLEKLYDMERAENDAAHQRLTRLNVPVIDASGDRLRTYTLVERIDMLVKQLKNPAQAE